MKKRLLVVEDRELNRDLLVQVLEDHYEVEVAVDGERAVDAATADPPAGILMDLGLPGMTGLDAVRAIRAARIDIPIVAVTSRVMPGDRERALRAGCDGFVAKPIDDLELIALLGGLIGEG